jgi:IclR family transcriptional regulator, KDG regulon repressor
VSQTLDRGLQVLELIAEQPRRTWEIADELDVHHSTALRLLHTLRRRGFVHVEADGRYRLGAAMFRLSNRALEALDLRDIARPHMERLSEQCGETVHLGILEGRHVVYIEKVEAAHPVRMYSRLGAVAPLHCTALAKSILMGVDASLRDELLAGFDFPRFTDRTHASASSLLDDLQRSAERGFTRDNEEHEPGIHCAAAPVYGADGRPAAAMSISAPRSRVPEDALLGFVPALVEAASAVSAELGWHTDDEADVRAAAQPLGSEPTAPERVPRSVGSTDSPT